MEIIVAFEKEKEKESESVSTVFRQPTILIMCIELHT